MSRRYHPEHREMKELLNRNEINEYIILLPLIIYHLLLMKEDYCQ